MIPVCSGRRPAAAEHLLALLLLTALALCFFRPVWRTLATHITPNLGDPVFNLWVLKWGAHKLPHRLAGLWDAPIFRDYVLGKPRWSPRSRTAGRLLAPIPSTPSPIWFIVTTGLLPT